MGAPAVVHGAQSGNRQPAPATVRSLSGWVTLGFLGALGMVVTGTRVGSDLRPGDLRWWFSIPSGGSPWVSTIFYLSTGVVIAAWLGLGRQVRRRPLASRQAWIVLGVWGLPFFLGPPLFSRDIYSYIAQGAIAHHGLDPYQVGPDGARSWAPPVVDRPSVALDHLALRPAVRRVESPGGGHLGGVVAGREVIAFRAIELVGVVLVMVFLPRLARHLGTDPGIALWLGALSPLALFSFIASGHNDALLAGLMVAGVSLAVEGRLAWGFALCALAATVKLPAAAAVVFLAVAGFGSRDPSRRWKVVIEAVTISAVVLVGVTLLAGYGWAWLGPSALHVPTELHVLSTPSVSVGVLVFHLLHPAGIDLARSTVVTATQYVVGLGAVVGVVWLLATAAATTSCAPSGWPCC